MCESASTEADFSFSELDAEIITYLYRQAEAEFGEKCPVSEIAPLHEFQFFRRTYRGTLVLKVPFMKKVPKVLDRNINWRYNFSIKRNER